jgi:hypothetical protein
MDYAGANANSLYKYQWDYIHNPQKMIGLLQDDEEGAFTNYYRLYDKLYPELIENSFSLNCNSVNYQIPRGKIIETEEHQGDYVFETTEILKVDYENMITEDKLFEYNLTVAEMRELYPKGVKENVMYKKIHLNSPLSIKYLPSRDIDFENIYDGVVFAAQEMFDEWTSKYPWRITTGYGIQNLNNLKYLEQSLIKYGELDIRKPNDGGKDQLYYIPLKSRPIDADGHILEETLDRYSGLYYNYDEIAYWVWGYIAKRLNFNKNQAVAYGMLYLDKTSTSELYNYSKDNLGNTTIIGTPWMARGIINGFEYPNFVGPTILDRPYTLEFDPIIELEDILTIALFIPVVGEGAMVTKISIQMGVKVLTAAFINWQVQILINIMGGMSYEEAVKNVNYTEVAWEGLTSLMKNENLFIGLECLFASVNVIKKEGGLNFMNSKTAIQACLLEIFKHKSFARLISDSNSPYFYLLDKSIANKKTNKIINNLTQGLQCSDEELGDIFSIIPEEILDTMIK